MSPGRLSYAVGRPLAISDAKNILAGIGLYDAQLLKGQSDAGARKGDGAVVGCQKCVGIDLIQSDAGRSRPLVKSLLK